MQAQQENIDTVELKACLEIIEHLISEESKSAVCRANEYGVPEIYSAEMEGYSKGVSIWGTKVVYMIRDMFCKD